VAELPAWSDTAVLKSVSQVPHDGNRDWIIFVYDRITVGMLSAWHQRSVAVVVIKSGIEIYPDLDASERLLVSVTFNRRPSQLECIPVKDTQGSVRATDDHGMSTHLCAAGDTSSGHCRKQFE